MKAVIVALYAGATLLAAGAAPAAAAQEGSMPRYTLSPADEGFLRLDTWTGTVSHCLVRNAHWVCESVADDRLALQEEIDRLARENSALRQAARTAAKDAPKTDATPPSITLHLPESLEDHFDDVRGYVAKLYRDLREFAGRLTAGPEPRQL